MTPDAPLVQSLLDFWFGKPGSAEYGRFRESWFRRDPAFDAGIRDAFLPEVESALAGGHAALEEDPRGSLALCLLLDQFPRNLFRNDARAFAGDSRALRVADAAIGKGWDRSLLPVQRVFLYLPFEHSEALEDQRRALDLFADLRVFPGLRETFPYAVRHLEIIARFGRFPHRNAALGRATTAEEARFLTEPNSSF